MSDNQTTTPTKQEKPLNLDMWFVIFIGVCLAVFLVAVMWPGAPVGASDKIKDVMQWLGFPLGLGVGAAAVAAKK